MPQPVSCRSFLSVSPESIRKPEVGERGQRHGMVVQEAYVTFLRDCKTNMENSGTEKNYLVLLLILTNFIEIN